jgi:hypothetical protein
VAIAQPVSAPPNLPSALQRHAAFDPEEPWLFHAMGWDWAWRSWGELGRWMDAWVEPLSGLPPGSRASFLYKSLPESVILDLAIQAAGLVSAPAAVPGKSDGEGAWIETEGLEVRIFPPDSLSAPRGERDAGGAVVIPQGQPEEWTAAELAVAGERLGEEIGPGEGREIVVLGGPLQDPAERTMLAWATLAGAAVVLEPDPALRAATAAWVRPTVFHGSAAEIAALRAWAEKERGKRLPFRRLRTVLVSRGGTLAEGDAAFWRERGVKVGRVG